MNQQPSPFKHFVNVNILILIWGVIAIIGDKITGFLQDPSPSIIAMIFILLGVSIAVGSSVISLIYGVKAYKTKDLKLAISHLFLAPVLLIYCFVFVFCFLHLAEMLFKDFIA